MVQPLHVLHGEDSLLGAVLGGVSSIPLGAANGASVAAQDGAGQLPVGVLEVVRLEDPLRLSIVLAELALLLRATDGAIKVAWLLSLVRVADGAAIDAVE